MSLTGDLTTPARWPPREGRDETGRGLDTRTLASSMRRKMNPLIISLTSLSEEPDARTRRRISGGNQGPTPILEVVRVAQGDGVWDPGLRLAREA